MWLAVIIIEGFIPKYYVDTPKDKVDRVVEDLQKYTKDLIEGESGLSTMVENAIKISLGLGDDISAF